MNVAPWQVPNSGQPATADDLLADAQRFELPATHRLVTSWTASGFLSSPAFQKSTRHGSASRLYPPAQRQLFITLLKIRDNLPSNQRRLLWRTLVSAVIWIWIHELLPLPTSQIRRTLRTLVESDSKLPWANERKGIRMLVNSLAHASTPKKQLQKAIAVLEQAARAHDWDLDLIESVLTEVCSPWPAPPGQRIERGLSSWSGTPIGIPEIIQTWRAGITVVKALHAESVTERDLDIARQRYLHRHAPADLQSHLAALDNSVKYPGPPTERATGFLFIELEYVLARRSGFRPL